MLYRVPQSGVIRVSQTILKQAGIEPGSSVEFKVYDYGRITIRATNPLWSQAIALANKAKRKRHARRR